MSSLGAYDAPCRNPECEVCGPGCGWCRQDGCIEGVNDADCPCPHHNLGGDPQP